MNDPLPAPRLPGGQEAGPPQPLAPPPADAGLGNVLNYLSAQFALLGKQILDIGNRQDSLRDWVGQKDAQATEAIGFLRQRADDSEERLDQLEPLMQTTSKTVTGLTPIIERELAHAGRIAERVENNFATVAARFQQSIGEMQTDFDERSEKLREEMGERIEKTEASLIARIEKADADLQARVVKLEETKATEKKEETDLVKTRVLARKDIVLAVITIVMGGLISGAVSIVVAIVSRGVP